MGILSEIKKPVEKELAQFEVVFRESLFSENEWIERAVNHFLQQNGKKLRPILVLLAAKCSAGEINNKTLSAAVSLELLHNATLLHDDVIDETSLRRGIDTVNARFNSKLAVLLGDFFLSITLKKATESASLEIIKAIADFAAVSVDGEIHQMSSAKEIVLSEENYYRIIYKKTASLFETCFRVGALSVNSSEETLRIFERFAYYLGMIFQIKDDIFDYFDSKEIGKPTGNDIREGKITLPLLYALDNSSSADKEKMMNIISKKDFSEENIASLIAYAIDNKGIEYAENKMEEFKKSALDILKSVPESSEKKALISMIDYIIYRTK